MYGLGAAYSTPITRPDFGTPVVYLPQAAGRWFISWQNPDGTTTGGYQNTDLRFDSHWVAPPDSVWDSLGVRPDYMVNPGKLQGNIQAADFNAANPFNPASVGPAATAPRPSAQGAPKILGLQVERAPGFTVPGTSVDVPSLPWWVWGLGAAGIAWFAFGKGK